MTKALSKLFNLSMVYHISNLNEKLIFDFFHLNEENIIYNLMSNMTILHINIKNFTHNENSNIEYQRSR